MADLNIAPGLKLDPDYVGGGTLALLAKKGAGKTYLGRVMAEEFWKAKVPFVALDPMDAWWGLRASADGSADGIPVALFGGEHADAPLERTAGKLMADLVVDEGLSMILSLKHFGSRTAERQFAMDFLERLYRRNSELVHLLIDEADLFAPQRPQAGDQPLLGITENIVRRGRNSGIGVTLITQRPAVLNKDVLTQVDGLVAMRMLGPQDRNAIDAWVGEHGDSKLAGDLKASLPELQTGDSWWWVPELGVLKRVHVRKSRTFDSSPTKRRGEKRREPKSFADVDMGAIQEKMAATIERAKADDPKELRKRIVDLERELQKRPDAKPAEPERVEVEIPVVTPEVLEALRNADKRSESIESAARDVRAAVEHALGELQTLPARTPEARVVADRPAPGARRPGLSARPTGGRKADPSPPSARRAPPATNGGDPDFQVSESQQRILDALAMLDAIGIPEADRTQLALFAKMRPTSGGYKNNLGVLRNQAGYISYPTPGTVALTGEGRKHADAADAPQTTEELHRQVRDMVTASKWALLEVLIDTYPDELAREDLAGAVGVPPTSGGFKNNLGSLRSLGLVKYPAGGYVAATSVLFLEGAPV